MKELQFLLEVQKEMLKNRFNTRKNYLSKFFDVRLCSVEENFGYLRREANKLLDVDGKIFKFDCIHLGDFVEFFPPALVINDARIMKVTRDKWKVYSLLKNKFHFPTTFLVQTREESKQLIKKMRWKIFVLKPRYGSGGYGVKVLKKVGKVRRDSLVQEFVESRCDKKFASFRLLWWVTSMLELLVE